MTRMGSNPIPLGSTSQSFIVQGLTSEMAEDNSKCTSLSQSFSLDLILKTKVSELVEMAI